MSRTEKYTCDICGMSPTTCGDAYAQLYGLKFTDGNAFVSGPLCESGKHICANCARAIKKIVESDVPGVGQAKGGAK